MDQLKTILKTLGYGEYELEVKSLPLVSKLLLELEERKGKERELRRRGEYTERNLKELKEEVTPLYSENQRLRTELQTLHRQSLLTQEQYASLTSQIQSLQSNHTTEKDNLKFLVSQLTGRLKKVKEDKERERFKLAELIDKRGKDSQAINYSYGVDTTEPLEPLKCTNPHSPPTPQRINLHKLLEKTNKELMTSVNKLQLELKEKDNEMENLRKLLKERAEEIIQLSTKVDKRPEMETSKNPSHTPYPNPQIPMDKVTHLEVQLELLHDKNSELEKIIKDKDISINSLQFKRDSLLNQSHELQTKNHTLVEKIKKLESLLLEIEPKKITLPNPGFDFKSEASKLVKNLKESRSEVKRLTAENKTIVNSLTTLTSSVGILNQQLKKIRAKVLHGSILIPEDLDIPNISPSDLDKQADIEYLKKRYESLPSNPDEDDDKSSSKNECPPPSSNEPEVTQANPIPADRTREVDDTTMDKKVRKLNKKIKHLTTERDNLRSLYHQVTQDLINTRNDLNSKPRHEQLSTTGLEFRKGQPSFAMDLTEHHEELDKLKRKLSTREIELEKAKLEIDDLREHLESAKLVQTSDHLGLKTRLDRVESRFHKCLQDKVLLSQQCADLVKQMESFRSQAFHSQESEKVMRVQLDKVEEEYRSAQSELAKVRQLEAPHLTRVTELTEEIATLRSTNETLRTELAQAQASLKERHDLITKLNHDLHSLTTKSTSSERELAELRYTLQQTERDAKAYEQQCDNLAQAVASLERQLKLGRSHP